MQEHDLKSKITIADELLNIEKNLLNLSKRINNDLIDEIESMRREVKKAKDDQKKVKDIVEIFDQKANQLFNILSSVMKSIKEMNKSVTRNLL